MSELFYIGPIYHLAFTKLDKMIMLDSTDLGVLSDLEVHISLSSQEQCWHCNSGPVVRVLWNWEFWKLPLGRWSWPRPALLQSGYLFSLGRRFPLLHLSSWTSIEGSGQAARLASLAGWAFSETLVFYLKVLPTFFSDWSSHSTISYQNSGCRGWTQVWCSTILNGWERVCSTTHTFTLKQSIISWNGNNFMFTLPTNAL